MGNSPKHSSTVPLVLNPETGAIIAQFHVVFDNWFATVAASESDLLDLQSKEWTRMFGDATHIDISEDDKPEAIVDDYIIQSNCRHDAVSQAIEGTELPTPLPTTPPPVQVPIDKSSSIAAPASHNSPEQFAPWPSPLMTLVSERRESEMRELARMAQVELPCAMSKPLREHHPMEFARENLPQRAPQIEQEAKQQMTSTWREIQAVEPVSLPTRRLARNAPKQARFGYDGTQGGGYVAQALGAPYTELDEKVASDMKEIKETTIVKGCLNMVYCYLRIFMLTVCKALTNEPNIICYDEAMTDTDNKQERKRAMAQEIQQLEDHGTWEQAPISDAKTKILPLTLVLRCK
jgi:hypothetical protein